MRQGLEGTLTDQTQIVYVSPLKALSNDIQKNLEAPIAGIRAALKERGLPRCRDPHLGAHRRHAVLERAKMAKRPPHIVRHHAGILLHPAGLGIRAEDARKTDALGDRGRNPRHGRRTSAARISRSRWSGCAALCGDKLLAHRALGDAEADRRGDEPARRHGWGRGAPKVRIVDTGHQRQRELVIEVPGQPLEAVMSAEAWLNVYDQFQQLVEAHRTTLVFVNTRRMAERVARALSERLGETAVTAHHGSMAKEHRLAAEQRLKFGQLRALVATASLELGIDIGDVDLVCPVGLAAFDRELPAAGRAFRSRGRRHAEGSSLSAVA